MISEVLLIRHAESDTNQQAHLIGTRSPSAPLTTQGELQARQLGRYLQDAHEIPSHIVASPALRARQTARIAIGTMHLSTDIHIEEGFQEVNHGDWEGLPRESVYTPAVLQRIDDMNGTFRAPGGESTKDVARRMFAALTKHTVSLVEPGPVHVYSHGFAIRSLVGLIEGWDHQKVHQTSLGNTAVTQLSFNYGWAVDAFAQTPQKK